MKLALALGSTLISLGWVAWALLALYHLLNWPLRQEAAAFAFVIVVPLLAAGFIMNLVGTLVFGAALRGNRRTKGNLAIFWIGVLGFSGPILLVLSFAD